MARIRTIKPELFLNEELAELPIYARMLFIGLFTQADRRGRMEDRPKRLKAALFPYDNIDVDELLASLHSAGFIIRYEAEGVKLIQVKNFEKHQRFTGDEARSESKHPEYQAVARTEADEKQERNTQETLEKPGKEGKGKEGKGDKPQQHHAHACEVLAEVIDERQEQLQGLFPEAVIPVVREKLLAHYRSRDVPLDPWMAVLKWFQGEFPRRTFPVGRASPGGYAEQWRELAAREGEAFLRGFDDDTDAEHEGGRGAVFVGHGGAVQGPHAPG